MSSSIRDIFRPRRRPMDERLPDGSTVDELIADQIARPTPQPNRPVIGAQTSTPTITRPRTMDVVRQAVAQQPAVIPQQPTVPVAGKTDLGQGSTYTPTNENQGLTRDRRTQPRDYIGEDEAYIRDLERKKDPFWKRAVIAALNAGEAGFGYQPTPIMTSRMRDLARAQGQLGQDVKVAGERARNKQLDIRADYQQQQQEEREINNALTQYNRLEHFDPDDPADAGFAQYFRERGLTLPKKDKYHRPIANWVNGKLVLTDSTGTREADINGQPVIDQGRVPNEQGLTPNQAAIQTNNTQSRAQRERLFNKGEAGRNQRFNQNQNRLNQPKAGRPAQVDRATNRRAAALIAEIEDARSAMATADSKGYKTDREAAQRRGEKAAAELNALGAGYEAGRGQKGYPYYKQLGAQSAPSQGVSEQQIRDAAKAKGLDPNIAVQRARQRGIL